MEVIFTMSKKNVVQFKLEGANNSVATILKDELWNDKATTVAGFSIAHPLVGIPEFVLETKGKDAKKVLQDSIKNAIKKITKFNKEVQALKI